MDERALQFYLFGLVLTVAILLKSHADIAFMNSPSPYRVSSKFSQTTASQDHKSGTRTSRACSGRYRPNSTSSRWALSDRKIHRPNLPHSFRTSGRSLFLAWGLRE